jgi:hypothetical protein
MEVAAQPDRVQALLPQGGDPREMAPVRSDIVIIMGLPSGPRR